MRGACRAIDPTNVAAKFTAGILKSYSFDGDDFFSADGAPPSVVERRKKGFEALGICAETHPPPTPTGALVALSLSDI